MSSMVLLLVLAQVTDWTAEERRLASTLLQYQAPKSPTNRFADDPNAAAVGVRLFHDERLSANGKISQKSALPPGRARVHRPEESCRRSRNRHPKHHVIA